MKFALFLSAALSVAAAPAPVPEAFESSIYAPTSTSRLSSNGRVNAASDPNTVAAADDGGNYKSTPSSFKDLNHMIGRAKYVTGSINNGTITEQETPSVIQAMFLAATPTTSPTSIPDAMNKASSAFNMQNTSPNNSTEPNLMASALALMMNGFVSPELNKSVQSKAAVPTFINPPVSPEKNFYNKEGNAPFSVPEEQLRSAIQIPPTFTNGKKQPIIMSPGTGATGFETFGQNMGKLLTLTDHADPVYLSIPGNLLGDVQVNAEYVAYAVQYMNAMTDRNVSIVTWSQGSIDAQWTFKYWPSTRSIVNDHIAISPDYHGTKLAYLLCTGNQNINMLGCTPAIFQQTYGSRVISRMRQNGGDSAYVPTTTVYSQFDEIVQPQSGRHASGMINGDNGVPYSNNLLQDVCRGQEGAGLFLHEGVLYSATAYALVVDALTHDGPGDIERVRNTCTQTTPEGITDLDVVQVEALLVLILFRILTYAPKAVREPELKDYAN